MADNSTTNSWSGNGNATQGLQYQNGQYVPKPAPGSGPTAGTTPYGSKVSY